MGNAARVGGSSLASVSRFVFLKKVLVIISITALPAGFIKLMADGGGVFFVRKEYLHVVMPSMLYVGCTLQSDAIYDVESANECVMAEKYATLLLARAEQCRTGLTQKLTKKGMKRAAVEGALDYLETVGALSDIRYARAYLSSRSTRFYGWKKLAAELAAHGIKRSITKDALKEFFTEHSEKEMCRRAVRKATRLGKSGEQLAYCLLGKGFSQSMIQTVLKEEEC